MSPAGLGGVGSRTSVPSGCPGPEPFRYLTGLRRAQRCWLTPVWVESQLGQKQRMPLDQSGKLGTTRGDRASPKSICVKVDPGLAGTGAIEMQMRVLRMLMLEVENNTETDFLGPGRGPQGRMWEPSGGQG